MAEYIEREAAIKAIYESDPFGVHKYFGWRAMDIEEALRAIPAVDVAPVRHGRCPVCSGQEVLAQDCDNGYSVEIDAESQEMTLWNGDTCLAAISVDYCPVCGSRMDGAK